MNPVTGVQACGPTKHDQQDKQQLACSVINHASSAQHRHFVLSQTFSLSQVVVTSGQGGFEFL
jgi:hypothetical protein